MSRLHVAFALTACLLPATAGAQTPPCAVSSDPEFGYTEQKAIPTGGGVTIGSGRQKRYLNVLRGPEGQPVTIGSGVASRLQGGDPQSKVVIDSYQVSYDGVARTLYLNMYAFGTPQVPQGFTCSASPSVALGPPLPDQAAVVSAIVAHARTEGVSRPLAVLTVADAAGTPRAMVFDFFNLASARARREALNAQLPAATLVVAHPLRCDTATIPASAIDLVGPQGQVAQRAPQLGSGAMLANTAPGFTMPEGAAGTLFLMPWLAAPSTVRIRFPKSESCRAGEPEEILLPIRAEPSRLVTNDEPSLPPGIVEPDPSVFVQALLDVDGTFKQPSYMAGPQSLMPAATEALKTWKAMPARLNDQPVVSVVTLRVGFRN